MDGLNGVAYGDDSQIDDLIVKRRLAKDEGPCVKVRVWRKEDE